MRVLIVFAFFIYAFFNAKGVEPLYVYPFGLDQYSVPDQVEIMDSLGYAGITYAAWGMPVIEQIKTFYAQPAVEKGRVKLAAMFWWYNMAQPNDSVWIALLPTLARHKVPLWPIFGGLPDSSGLVFIKQKLAQMADSALKYGVDVVVYPHDGTPIESAEQALPCLRQLNRTNLYLSFHLCHELRAGNGSRIHEVLKNTGKYLKLVSISGADTLPCKHCPNWSDAIKPLGEGAYDTYNTYLALKKVNYTGTILLHTWGITQPVRQHLAKSIHTWKNYSIK